MNMAAKGRSRLTEQHLFLLEALHAESMRIALYLSREAQRERDEYSGALQKLKVSGTLRGNAEQLPGSAAEGSEKKSHADAKTGD
jgi:hypothetical protein